MAKTDTRSVFDAERSETGDSFRPIRGSHAFEEVVDQITHAIQVGAYDVGAHLPTVKELARLMRVSHTTVLEAVRLLERVGVLAIKRGATGGLVIRSAVIPKSVFKLSSTRIARDVLQLLEARRPVELALARLAVARSSEQEINEVRMALEMQERAEPDSDEWDYANVKFHRAIGRAAHSDVLAHFQTELTKELLMFIGDEYEGSLGDRRDPAAALAEHQAILRALESRDAEMVYAAMNWHLLHLEQRAQALISPRAG